MDLPPVPVDGELPSSWWDDEADKSLLVGIFKHGHDKFNLIRQDPCLSFLQRCGPPNKEELLAEMNAADKTVEDLEDENRDSSQQGVKESPKDESSRSLKDSDAGEFLDDLVTNVVRDLSEYNTANKPEHQEFDENENSILKRSNSNDGAIDTAHENGVVDYSQTNKMDMTDEESSINDSNPDLKPPSAAPNAENLAGDFLPFPSANDLNQRFRRLITAYQRNSKKLEIKLAQKARDELKKERTSKFEAARNEREERKRFLAQKWSRREEADFFRAISSFGVEYDPDLKRYDWNKFRSIGKLDKKLDETLDEYYKAFIIMCKRATSQPLTMDEEKCPVTVDTITEDRALKCLARIDFLNKIREQIVVHPELDERLKLCLPQSDLPDWWENGRHDKDLLLAASKHGLTRLDYNLAHDPTLSLDEFIRQKAIHLLQQPPLPILIPLDRLQELLEKNGVEYSKDLDAVDEVKETINSLIDSIEMDLEEHGSRETSEQADSENIEVLGAISTRSKPTRSSAHLQAISNSLMPNILARRVPSTRSSDSESISVQLTSGSIGRPSDPRVVEITPLPPDSLPDDLSKSFEAGELSLTVQSESALLQLDDRDPIILEGALNPITVKIRWPKDKAIQTRLENLVHLVEKNEWPTPSRPTIPTITLPNHLTTPLSSGLSITTSSPTKNDRSEVSLGSPKSDISNISSRTSRQDIKERSNELLSSRSRRGRGRRPKQHEQDLLSNDLDLPREDRQATAKLRNLLSQGSGSNRAELSAAEKLAYKMSSNAAINAAQGLGKQGAGLSSLLASFKQKRSDGGSSSRGRGDDKTPLDLNSTGAANLLPQILANLKPEFRDLLANQDAAAMLINSLTSMAGSGIGTNLRSSSSSNPQLSIDNLLNQLGNTRSSVKGPPPAHQRSDNPPSAHGTSSRELRRSSQMTRENSPPTINLRSSRGKSNLTSLESLTQTKGADMAHSKLPSSGGSKKRGRPSPETSESPSEIPSADVLDLSSLPCGGKGGSVLRSESRSRRHREQVEEVPPTMSSKSSTSSTSSKNGSKTSASKQEVEHTNSKNLRTRASKNIGSRIDALALNLQAKKMKPSSRSSQQDSNNESNPSRKSMSSSLLANQPSVSSSSSNPLSQSSSATTQLSGAPQSGLTNNRTLNLASQFGNLNSLGGLLNLPGMNELMKQFTSFPNLAANLPRVTGTPNVSTASPAVNSPIASGGDKSSRRSKQSTSSNFPTTASSSHRSSSASQLDASGNGDAAASRRSSSSLLAQQAAAAAVASQHSNLIQTSSTATNPVGLPNANSLNLANQFGGLNSLGGLLGFPGVNELMKQISSFPGLSGALPRVSTTPSVSIPAPVTTSITGQAAADKNSSSSTRRSRQSSSTPTQTSSASSQQQAANAALASSLMSSLASQPNSASNPYGNYTNPLANPFLPFGLGNLGMNNPLGMGLFPNLYMPPGFQPPDQSQAQSSNQQGASSDGGPKDKKMRYTRK